MGIGCVKRGVALLSTVGALLGAGCGSRSQVGQPTAAPHPGGWPEILDDFTMVWTAEPGIDLTSWPAAAVRAYTESYLLASIMGGDRFLYPGFKQSVDPNRSHNDPTGTQFLWPNADHPPANPWVGTEQAHILWMNTTGRDVTVVVCEYLFGAAELGTHGGYRTLVALPPPFAGIDPMRLVMTSPAEVGPQKPPQQGPGRAPSVDVFNGWRIISHQGGYFAESYATLSEWPTAFQDTDACNAKAPPHRDFARGGEYDRADFPTLPASPGWP